MKDALARFSAYFSRLNSGERFIIIVVIIAVFAAINVFFIFPYFGKWGKITSRKDTAQSTLQKYENMIGQTTLLSNQIAKLEGENASVPPEDQAINFLTAIQNQAVQSHVTVLTSTRQPERTNDSYFVERAQTLTTTSGEKELVDFLYNLGAGNSLIRVRALSIRTDRPDASRSALNSTVTLIASFQKKPATRTVPASTPKDSKPTSTPAVPAVRPGTPAAVPASKPVTPTKK